MGYQPINLGNQPNDGLGDGARTAGGKINAQFQELFFITFLKDNRWRVERNNFSAAVPDPTNYRVDDRVSGWANPSTKSRWVEGVVLDATINLSGNDPADLDDSAKFFITNEKIKAD
jgi:hypothetical protein